MIDVILTLINGVLGFLNSFLPLSPFDSIISNNEYIINALGWLNWLIPVGDMVDILGLYLAALLTWSVADLVLGGFGKVTSFTVGSD